MQNSPNHQKSTARQSEHVSAEHACKYAHTRTDRLTTPKHNAIAAHAMGRRRCATTRVIAAKTERAEVAVKSRVQLFDALAVFELLEYREFHVLRLFLDEAELGNVARRVDVVLVVSELRCQHNTTATCCCNMLHESVFSFLRQLTA